MTSPVLVWSHASWLEAGALCNITQAFYPPGYAFIRHTHDYGEFFFVERGHGVHHLPGGDEPVAPGDLVFIHPSTEHALAATPTEPLVFLNIAIAPNEFAMLSKRYGEMDWPWRRTPRPERFRLVGHELNLFLDDVRALSRPGACRDRLRVEAFLLNVVARARTAHQQAMPPRLAKAIAGFDNDLDLLRGGVAALARRAGCGRAWLTRQVRRHLGLSARELVTNARLGLAAARLRASNEPIPALADDCGFPNLSNFYRLFRRRFGCTPARWRAGRGGEFA